MTLIFARVATGAGQTARERTDRQWRAAALNTRQHSLAALAAQAVGVEDLARLAHTQVAKGVAGVVLARQRLVANARAPVGKTLPGAALLPAHVFCAVQPDFAPSAATN